MEWTGSPSRVRSPQRLLLGSGLVGGADLNVGPGIVVAANAEVALPVRSPDHGKRGLKLDSAVGGMLSKQVNSGGFSHGCTLAAAKLADERVHAR
jgi:hypothetical protein